MVDDLASLEVLVIEVQDAELGLGDSWQELFLNDLGVVTVTLGHILLELLSGPFGGGNALSSHGLHNGLVFVIKVRVAILLIFKLVSVLLVADHFTCFLVHHLFLDFQGLILDSLLHNEFLENVSLHGH